MKTVTDKQLTANRHNAVRSTGPRTVTGKATVSKNALRHGLLSQVTLLPHEDTGEFSALREELYQQYAPVGALESFLLERIASTMWRLKRLHFIEQGFLASVTPH